MSLPWACNGLPYGCHIKDGYKTTCHVGLFMLTACQARLTSCVAVSFLLATDVRPFYQVKSPSSLLQLASSFELGSHGISITNPLSVTALSSLGSRALATPLQLHCKNYKSTARHLSKTSYQDFLSRFLTKTS